MNSTHFFLPSGGWGIRFQDQDQDQDRDQDRIGCRIQNVEASGRQTGENIFLGMGILSLHIRARRLCGSSACSDLAPFRIARPVDREPVQIGSSVFIRSAPPVLVHVLLSL